jgi:glycosyltransferase involved in cell wall biosynthesis
MSFRPPVILMLAASDWYFYWHRLPLAVRIAAAGYDVRVATPLGRYCGAIEAAGLRHYPIQIDRQGLNPLKDTATIKSLVGLYREIDPVLVHHIAIKPNIYGTIAAKVAKVPAIVNTMPGMGYVFVSEQFLARLIRSGIKTAFRLLLNAPNTRTILENSDDMQRWVSWGIMRPDRAVIIRSCGIDTAMFQATPEPPGPPLVVLPARLLSYKGIGEFVAAARSLKQRGVQARFALVGEGDPGNPASVPQRQIDDWKQEGVVELFGWQDDMPAILAQSHIVCLPSHGGEGVPRTLLEAAACGRAIVATDVPGCRDVVRHGENGLLVPPRQVAPLADALEQLIRNGDLRRSMGLRGRDLAIVDFSVDKVAIETLSLYAQLLGAAAPGNPRPVQSIGEDTTVRDNTL